MRVRICPVKDGKWEVQKKGWFRWSNMLGKYILGAGGVSWHGYQYDTPEEARKAFYKYLEERRQKQHHLSHSCIDLGDW